MADVVTELLFTETATTKLGVRGISPEEAGQVPHHDHVIVRNPRAPATSQRR